MGYESRLYIVDKSNYCSIADDTRHYAREICRYDFSVYSPIANFMRKQPETNCLIYADDGNTEILKDKYDKPLTEASIEEVISVIEKDLEDTIEFSYYRRVRPILAMLKVLAEEKDNWNNLVVLHYGY